DFCSIDGLVQKWNVFNRCLPYIDHRITCPFFRSCKRRRWRKKPQNNGALQISLRRLCYVKVQKFLPNINKIDNSCRNPLTHKHKKYNFPIDNNRSHDKNNSINDKQWLTGKNIYS